MLSEDDLDLADMSEEELAAAWDLWFDLAQSTNADDPMWTHGVFVGLSAQWKSDGPDVSPGSGSTPDR